MLNTFNSVALQKITRILVIISQLAGEPISVSTLFRGIAALVVRSAQHKTYLADLRGNKVLPPLDNRIVYLV